MVKKREKILCSCYICWLLYLFTCYFCCLLSLDTKVVDLYSQTCINGHLCDTRKMTAYDYWQLTVLEMKIGIYWSESNSWIYFYIVLNKNWKIYLCEQSFTGLEPEDRFSLWGLIKIRQSKLSVLVRNDFAYCCFWKTIYWKRWWSLCKAVMFL
jgi:hypothetical protein